MGVLSSSVHMTWADHEMSTLEDRPRYTPTTCFETFPWPDPTPAAREAVAAASRQLLARRRELCLERSVGLTDLYNLADEGAFTDLRDLHRELDRSVTRAYGWEPRLADNPLELRVKLAECHAAIVAGRVGYAPFAAAD